MTIRKPYLTHTAIASPFIVADFTMLTDDEAPRNPNGERALAAVDDGLDDGVMVLYHGNNGPSAGWRWFPKAVN